MWDVEELMLLINASLYTKLRYFYNYINLEGMKLMSVSSLIAHCIRLCISFPGTLLSYQSWKLPRWISNDIYSLNILFINVNKSLKIERVFLKKTKIIYYCTSENLKIAFKPSFLVHNINLNLSWQVENSKRYCVVKKQVC